MNIVFFGDSITDCGRSRDIEEPNLKLGDGFVNMATAELLLSLPKMDFNIYNRGISGNKVTDGLARADEDLLSLNPDVVTILFGINGVWHKYKHGTGITDEQFDTAYRALLDKLLNHNPNVGIILMEPYALYFGNADIAWKPEVDERIKIVKKIARDYHLPLIHLQSAFNKEEKRVDRTRLLFDGVHPAPAGHRMIANLWIKEFCKVASSLEEETVTYYSLE